MADHDCIAIAKAAAAQLLAAVDSFSQSFTPQYKLIPGGELKDLEDVAVQIRPAGTEKRFRSRVSLLVDYTVEISVRKHAPGTEAQMTTIAEEVLRLAQEIEDWWAFRPLTGRTERLLSFGTTDVYQDSLKNKRVIGANIVLVFQGEKEPGS
jgi:hypothetical protein